MRTVAMTMALMAAAGAAAAETPAPAAPPKCVTAEINPVTGHVLCIEPLGAPVEAPPDAKLPCKRKTRAASGATAPTARPRRRGELRASGSR